MHCTGMGLLEQSLENSLSTMSAFLMQWMLKRNLVLLALAVCL